MASVFTLGFTISAYSEDDTINHGNSLISSNSGVTTSFGINFIDNFFLLFSLLAFCLYSSNKTADILSNADIEDIEKITNINVAVWHIDETIKLLADKRRERSNMLAEKIENKEIYQFFKSIENTLVAKIGKNSLTNFSIYSLNFVALTSIISSFIDNDFKFFDHKDGMKVSALNLLTSGLLLMDVSRLVALMRYRVKKVKQVLDADQIAGVKSTLFDKENKDEAKQADKVDEQLAEDIIWKIRAAQTLRLPSGVSLTTKPTSYTELAPFAKKR